MRARTLLLAWGLVAGPTCEQQLQPGVEILPAAGPIPENLLRFYVRFPEPMQRGDARAEITLLDADGAPVEGAFLEIGQELWSADLRTLTLIVDPGRLKLGVEPNLSHGPPLRAGQTVSLRVGAGMRDAGGSPLGAPVIVRYEVVQADRAGPEPTRWQVSAPAVGTRDPLQVRLEAEIDPLLAPRYLRVQDGDGAPLLGAWTVEDPGLMLLFTPSAPWPSGDRALAVHPRLEDMAGNRLGARFDLAPGTVAGLAPGDGEPVMLSF